MKKVYVLLALVLAAAAAAYPASGAPAEHFTEDVTGDVFGLRQRHLHGDLWRSREHVPFRRERVREHELHGNPRRPACRTRGCGGERLLASGRSLVREHSNAQQGTSQGTFTAFLNIISKGGGVVDTVRMVGHFGANGEFSIDSGSCVLPD